MSYDIVGRVLRKVGIRFGAFRTRFVSRDSRFCENGEEVIGRCTNSAEIQLRNMLVNCRD
jgi:hypothetical protein